MCGLLIFYRHTNVKNSKHRHIQNAKGSGVQSGRKFWLLYGCPSISSVWTFAKNIVLRNYNSLSIFNLPRSLQLTQSTRKLPQIGYRFHTKCTNFLLQVQFDLRLDKNLSILNHRLQWFQQQHKYQILQLHCENIHFHLSTRKNPTI